jgi:hypothetical protein
VNLMKKYLYLLFLMLVLILPLSSQTIPQYELRVQNPLLIGTTYQFDIYIKSVGTTNFRLGNSQFIFNFNSSQFLSPTIIRINSSEEIGNNYFIDEVISGDQIWISLGGNGSYQNSNVILSTGKGTRISTFQITGVNAEVLSVGLNWINKPHLIRTGVSQIDDLNNYIDITDESGASHINGGSEFTTISGYVFNDLNRNGVWDQLQELPLNGWTILLDGPNGQSSVTAGSGNWSDGYYEFVNLPPGHYHLAEEIQNGWFQTVPSSPAYYELDVSDGGIPIINKNFGNCPIYPLEITIHGNGIVNKDPDQLQYLHGTDVVLTAIPTGDNTFIGWEGDTVSNINPITIPMDSPKSITATFIQNIYFSKFRTFTYRELIVKTGVKKKPVTTYWEFKIFNRTSHLISNIFINFRVPVSVILSSGNFSVTRYSTNRTNLLFSGSLNTNDSLIIKGRSLKSRSQVIKKLWFETRSGAPAIKIQYPYFQKFELPMPNSANVRDEIFNRGGTLASSWLTVGIPKEPWLAPYYGWVRPLKSTHVYYSFIDITGIHFEVCRGFDFFSNGKLFVREQRWLSPSKQNNVLFADLLTLKINIALSRLGITQPGLGELRYKDNGNPFNNMLISEIVQKADSLLTYYIDVSANLYYRLDTTIVRINTSFSSPIDTISWGFSLVLSGTKMLSEIPFLEASGAPIQTNLNTGVQDETPQPFELFQNYPNPFNPTTYISFNLEIMSRVTLKIYNVLGQEIMTLLNDEVMDEGEQEVEFDATSLPSGVYFYSLTVEEQTPEENTVTESIFREVKKMMLIK